MKYIFLALLIIASTACNSTSKPSSNNHNTQIEKGNINSSSQTSINIYFSKQKGNYQGGVDEKIIDSINNAKKSIYLAIYELTNRKITQALIDANNRGVELEIITDDQTLKSSTEFKKLSNSGIEIYTDSDKYSLMHNKFLIIDNKKVWSGSGNYTYYSFYRNYENYIEIDNQKIANAYYNEFIELLNNEKVAKCSTINYTTLCFSPEDDIEKKLINLINEAKSEIDIAIFSFTSKPISNALVEAKKRGINIKVVIDKDWSNQNSKYSVAKFLSDNNIDIRVDGGSFKLHDKFMIIDKKVVASGSFNYTAKANNKNRENELIFKNSQITNRYLIEFNKIYSQASN